MQIEEGLTPSNFKEWVCRGPTLTSEQLKQQLLFSPLEKHFIRPAENGNEFVSLCAVSYIGPSRSAGKLERIYYGNLDGSDGDNFKYIFNFYTYNDPQDKDPYTFRIIECYPPHKRPADFEMDVVWYEQYLNKLMIGVNTETNAVNAGILTEVTQDTQPFLLLTDFNAPPASFTYIVPMTADTLALLGVSRNSPSVSELSKLQTLLAK